MRARWTTKDVDRIKSRANNANLDIHHNDTKIFEQKNDFVQHKSKLLDTDSDDVDKTKLDIQEDLVEAGENYLDTYDKKKDQHKSEMNIKKSKLGNMLYEIEDNVGKLSNSAINANMNWVDLDGIAQGGVVDDQKLRAQID